MSDVQTLNDYHDSVEQVRGIAAVVRAVRFGDIDDQLRRAAVSVTSNLAEGAGRESDREFARFVSIARGSNHEVAAQLDILAALGVEVGAQRAFNARVGRQLTALIRYLRGSG